MSQYKLTIRFYGSFRRLSPNGEVEIKVPANSRIKDVRQSVASVIDGMSRQAAYDLQILEDSVFASSTRILSEEDELDEPEVSLLPPVCGG